MSYTLTPYLVDLDTLRKAVGSKDEALLAAVIASETDRFGDEDEEEDVDEGVPLRLALRQLVMGESLNPASAYQYGYALEQLCRHLGEWHGMDMLSSIRWQVLEATGLEQVLQQSGPPVPLPPNDDFPRIGHLTVAEIAATVEKLGAGGHLTTAAPSGRRPRPSMSSRLLGALSNRITQRGPLTDEDIAEILAEYEEVLRTASAQGKALVFFYY